MAGHPECLSARGWGRDGGRHWGGVLASGRALDGDLGEILAGIPKGIVPGSTPRVALLLGTTPFVVGVEHLGMEWH